VDGTRERMIGTTTRLLRSQGYRASGLNQISAEARVPKGSMYHHFPGGKEQLAAEAIAASAAFVSATLDDCLARKEPAAALDSFIDLLIDQLEGSGFVDGCPVATTALETAATSDLLATTADAAFTAWTRAIGERLHTSRVPDADGVATAIVSAIEGALVLARAKRSAGPLRDVQRTIPKLLGAPG
jgi:TetR/AcrR family transcriptional repressor of lmrAB and yxaGH operons